MSTQRILCAAVLLLGLSPAVGCRLVSNSQLAETDAKIEGLEQQNLSLNSRLENEVAHNQQNEQRLADAERQLAEHRKRLGSSHRKLANYRREHEQIEALVDSTGAAHASGNLSGRLAELSRQLPGLRFDPESGIAKLSTDVLFETGKAELHGEGRRLLADFASVFEEPGNEQFRILLAGHTDNQRIKGREVRAKYPTNRHLSVARSLVVGEFLKHRGMPDDRIALAGYGMTQPIAPNDEPARRQKNRRVEIFVLPPDARVAGWPETITSLY